MLMRALPILLLAGALAGCATDPPARVQVSLPPIPADIRACATRHVPRPAGTAPLNDREVYLLISRLKASEEAKSGCLVRLITLYETQAEIVREALK